jgi:hypothetical protein
MLQNKLFPLLFVGSIKNSIFEFPIKNVLVNLQFT